MIVSKIVKNLRREFLLPNTSRDCPLIGASNRVIFFIWQLDFSSIKNSQVQHISNNSVFDWLFVEHLIYTWQRCAFFNASKGVDRPLKMTLWLMTPKRGHIQFPTFRTWSEPGAWEIYKVYGLAKLSSLYWNMMLKTNAKALDVCLVTEGATN